jgi:hypothetical protein
LRAPPRRGNPERGDVAGVAIMNGGPDVAVVTSRWTMISTVPWD